MKKDNLGDRMKQFYETVPKTRLMRRCPVIIRLDGKSAHTFTRDFDKPFDCIFLGAIVFRWLRIDFFRTKNFKESLVKKLNK